MYEQHICGSYINIYFCLIRSTSGGRRSHRALRPNTAPSPSDRRSAAPERRPHTSAGPRRAWGENDQAHAAESDLVSHQVHTDTVSEQVYQLTFIKL